MKGLRVRSVDGQEQKQKRNCEKMARPRKPVWPIGFEELLHYALPKKRPEKRPELYRLFLRDYLHPRTTIRASDDEIEKALILDKKRKFDENTAFHIRMWMNMSLDGWKRERFQKRAKAGGDGLQKKRLKNAAAKKT